jgi:hypothetical protein
LQGQHHSSLGCTATSLPGTTSPVAQRNGDNLKRASFPIRTAAVNPAVLAAVRQVFHQIDPALLIWDARTMEEQMAPWTAPTAPPRR